MFTAIIILSVVAQTLIALVVLQKNRQNLANHLFFWLLISLTGWALVNFLITRDPASSYQLVLYRFMMALVVVQNTVFFLFAHAYPGREITVSKRRLVAYAILSALTFLVALSPLLFTSVNYGLSGARPVAGPGMILFIIQAAVSVIFGLWAIYKRFAAARGLARQQLRFIFFGSIILWGIVPVTNFVVSMATQTLVFSRISPLYTLAFSSIIAYAIVATKLFDIRIAVARSVAYTLLLASLVVIYAILIFGLGALVLKNENISTEYRIANIAVAVILAFTFPFLKRFFDRLTNRLFFREAYDSQSVIKTLSEMLVSQIRLEAIVRRSLQILTDNLKIDHAQFLVIDEDAIYHAEACGRPPEPRPDIKTLEELRADLLDVDDLTSGPKKRLLDTYDVNVSVRLHTHDGTVGYLLLGPKKSGNIFSKQDMDLLQIASKQLAVATQNALHYEKIAKFNDELQDRVDRATYRLKTSNQKLRVLDETKDDFISMASHQLRTPLTSVKGYLSMVLEGDAGRLTTTERKMLQQAFISSQRMVYLISDLLNLSRLKTGKFVIEPTIVNLADIVSGEMDQLVQTAKAKDLTLSYQPPKDFPSLMLDETKTRQVIMNFIDNAIYYTNPGGGIEVKLEQKPHAVEFKVVDNGIGVPASDRHRLFTKFYRAKNAQKARPDGTGLGLFMAKKVIVGEGGSIIFDSEENKGSTFGFSFPLSKLAAANNRPTPVSRELVKEAAETKL